ARSRTERTRAAEASRAPARRCRRRARPEQDVSRRRQAGPRRHRPGDPARQPVRPARPQRRRQVDTDQHPGAAGDQDLRQRVDLGDRPRAQPARGGGGDRRRAAGAEHRPVLHAARAARPAGGPLRRAAGRAAGPPEPPPPPPLPAAGPADRARAYPRPPSGGMGRRLMAAKALVPTPPVLVLDEPTAGVDVELRQQLWSYVRRLNAAGTTVLLTTHYLEEAEELCDRIAIINHGRVIACEPTGTLLRRLDSKELVFILAEDLASVPAPLDHFSAQLQGPRRLLLRYKPSQTRMGEILAAVQAAGLNVADMTTMEADLEDIFLQLTRRDPAGTGSST